MRGFFCGSYQKAMEDFRAGDMRALTECGVPVKYRVVWNRWGRIEDHGRNPAPELDGRWKEWRGEDLRALEYDWKEGRSFVGRISYCSYVEVAYRIPREKLALVIARDKALGREEDEQASREFERMHQEWLAEQQKKLAAYLKKYPWAENPDGHREGWEYIIEHDPERGPILIQA